MKSARSVYKLLKATPTVEGAGVRLNRVFGHNEASLMDPFLLLDDFHSERPEDYMAGFPSHPHRGIETVTYMLHGSVKHQDSTGNSGTIRGGGVQWMTAGSGIIHSEMPERRNGLFWGLQLWVNLPSRHKMMDPRYRDIKKDDIPAFTDGAGAQVRIICGRHEGVQGPVQDIMADPEYLDVTLPAGVSWEHQVGNNYTVFTYVLEGALNFGPSDPVLTAGNLAVLRDGERVALASSPEVAARFLLVTGKPLGEPIAWMGPIVMNTRLELEQAFEEYRNGTFLKHR
jgi:redox-sensitive bicupin YhaK (pirin superfamily)